MGLKVREIKSSDIFEGVARRNIYDKNKTLLVNKEIIDIAEIDQGKRLRELSESLVELCVADISYQLICISN